MIRKTSILLAITAAVLVAGSVPALAQVVVGGGKLDAQRQFSFAAVQLDDDGHAVGQAILKNLATGGRAHVDIDCLVVDGDTSFVTGVVTQVKADFGGLEVGDEILLGVRDNGDGNADPADRITGLFLLPGILVGTDCAFRTFVIDVAFGVDNLFAALGGGTPVASGNIQVLPE